jgi:hypothetical protein
MAAEPDDAGSWSGPRWSRWHAGHCTAGKGAREETTARHGLHDAILHNCFRRARPVLMPPAAGPVRGVDFHSSQPIFCSGGDDYKIKVRKPTQRSATDPRRFCSNSRHSDPPLASRHQPELLLSSTRWGSRCCDLSRCGITKSVDASSHCWDISTIFALCNTTPHPPGSSQLPMTRQFAYGTGSRGPVPR